MKLRLPHQFQAALMAAIASVSFTTLSSATAFAEETAPAASDGDLGLTLFMGDSITHGVLDASYRWQLFKTFVDNGAYFNIDGPISGYYSAPADADNTGGSATYRGVGFVNEHYAKASGRSYEMISGASRYNNISVATLGQTYDISTGALLIGTNDLLSDGGYTYDNFNNKMQSLLGGTVTHSTSDTDAVWTWQKGSTMGNLGTIADSMNLGAGDEFYVLSIPTWTTHDNNNDATIHAAVAGYNGLLQQWVNEYNATSPATVKFVDVNQGLVDVTSTTPFFGNKAFFNNGSDGLHPSEQGSLIMAGNVARTMGIGGRTAGLHRSAATGDGWTAAQSAITLHVGDAAQTVEGAQFTVADGYTVDFTATFGDGSTNNWLDADKDRLAGKSVAKLSSFSTLTESLNITVGDGTHTGTLKLAEGYVAWSAGNGDMVLYCQNNSVSGNENLRIAYREADSANNILGGYYVWKGDMLIGQGLASVDGSQNGISLSITGSQNVGGTISNLSWANTAYAPSTTLFSLEPLPSHDNETAASLGINFEDAAPANERYGTNNQQSSGDLLLQRTGGTESNAWFGPVGTGHSGNVHMKYSGLQISNNANIIAVINGSVTNGNVAIVLDDGTHVGKGHYGSTGDQSIHGVYNQSLGGAFKVEVNNATLDGGILMGVISGNGSISGGTQVIINKGAAVGGSVYGGGLTGTVNGGTSITITGGSIAGSVYGAGKGGTVNGNSVINITGGVISGDVIGGAEGGTFSGTSSVTITGNLAYIGGNITADTVTLQNVTADNEHADTFDKYRGRIRADKVVLHHYTVDQMLASLETKSLVLSGGTATTIRDLTLTACEIDAQDTSAVTLDGTLTLGNTATYTGNVTLTDGMTIKMLGGENTSASGAESQGGYRSGSWDVMKVAEDAEAHSLTVNPGTLVGAGMLQGSEFSYNSTTGLLSAEGTDYSTYYLEGSITSVNLTTEQAEHAELQHVVLNAADGTVTVDSGASNTLADITKQANTALTLDVAGSLTLSGTITGTGGSIEKTGAGTVTLNAASRSGLSDSITVSAGSLVAAVDNSLTSGAVTVNEDGTLVLKTYTGVPTISGTGTVQIDFGSGKSYEYHDKNFLEQFTGTVELVSGNLQIGNKTNKFNNAKLKLSGGELRGHNSTFTHDIILAGGTLAEAGANETYSGAITVAADSTVSASNGKTITLSGAITGSAKLTKAGGGALTLTGDNTSFAGNINIDAGTVNFNNATTINKYTIGGGTTNFNANTTIATIGTKEGSINATVTIATTATVDVTDMINNNWGIRTMTVDGTLNVAGTYLFSSGNNRNTVNGSGTININKLTSQNQTNPAAFTGVTLNIGNGGIDGGRPVEFGTMTVGVRNGSTGWTATNSDITIADNSTTTFLAGEGQSITLSGIKGAATSSLVKAGAGTLTLSGANTFTGGFAVNAGSLVITHDITTTGLTGTGGTLDVQGALTVNTVEEPGASFGGAVAADSFTVSGSGSQTISGISRLGSSIQVNGGTLHLAAGTYDISGITPLSAGASSAPAASGYAGLSADVQFIQTSGSGDFDEDGGLDIVYKGNHATTVSGDGIVHFEGTDYTTYYLVTTGDTLDLTAEQGAHPELQNVVVNASGSVSLDDTRTITSLSQTPETVLTLTGGGELTIRSFGFEYGNTYANISIDDGTTLKTGDLTVGEGETFTTAGEGTYIGGILTVIDDGTTVNLGSNVQLAKLVVTAGNVNISGVTTVNDTTDLSKAHTSTGVLTVKASGTLNANGDLWGRNVSHLYLEQGGTLNIGSSLTIVGAGANAELVAGTNDAKYSLDSGDWTFKNSTVTANADIAIGNKFDNSTLDIGSHNVSLTNVANLPNSMTVTGDGYLTLLSGADNVNLKSLTVKNLKIGRDNSHNTRVKYVSGSDLSGVQHLYFDGGQLWLDGKDLTYAGAVTFNTTTYTEGNAFSGAAMRVGNNATFTGAVNVNQNTKLTWGGDKTVEFAGVVTGSGNLNLARYGGNGTFKISGDASQYAGALTTAQGVTQISVNITPTGSLNLAGGTSLAGGVQIDGTLTMNGATGTTSTISGAVSGIGTLATAATNAGTVNVTGAMGSFNGAISVQGGTLNLTGNAITTHAVTVGGGATLNIGAAASTITACATMHNEGNLTLNGTVALNSSNLSAFTMVEGTEGQQTYSGVDRDSTHYANSGYLTSSAQYYLVKGTEGSTLTESVTIDENTGTKVEQADNKSIVVTFKPNSTGGMFYVNDSFTYGDDMNAASDISIAKGKTLTAAGSGALSSAKVLHGEGTYALASGTNALNNGLSLGTDWTGAVRISDYKFTGNMNTINSLANSGSWVELVGAHGWFSTSTINANLILGENSSGWGYYQNDGGNGYVLTISGVVKGTGKFGRSNTTGSTQTHVFTNDISGWTGTYESRSPNNHSTTLRLTDKAHEVNATLTNAGGTFYVDVQTDVAFSKAITATTLAVTAGHTATLGANVTLGGLTGAGDIASTATITLNGGSGTAYELGGAITGAHLLNKTGAGTQTINGPVTVDRFTISGGTTTFNGLVTATGSGYTGNNQRNSVTGGTVYFNGGLGFNGTTDAYALVTSNNNTTVHFGGTSDLRQKNIGHSSGTTIVLDANASLTVNQLMNSSANKGQGNGALDMKSGSVLTVQNLYLTGSTSDGGTIHLGNNALVNLYAGSYQPNIMEFGLGNIALDGTSPTATIKTTNWGGTVKLDSLSGAGTLALRAEADANVRNTFSIGGSATKSEFTGTIALERVAGTNRVLLAEFNDKYSAAGAVVQASLTGGHTSEAVGIFINSEVVQMKGLKDGTNITSANSYALTSGSASRLGNTNGNSSQYLNNASDGTFRTLEFVGNDAQASYTTGIKVLSGVNITMSAAGSQTFNGDLSAMNGTVTASAGTLTLNNTGARGTLASVNYNGGTLVLNNMDVTGATTIGEGTTLDLGATNLTSAIVNQGTVNFTQNITANGLDIDNRECSIDLEGNKTNELNFFAGTEDYLTVVTGGSVNPNGHKVTQGGADYLLEADGTASSVEKEVDYTYFYQLEAKTTLNYSDIFAVAVTGHGADQLWVQTAGATLNVDRLATGVILDNGTVNMGENGSFVNGGGLYIHTGLANMVKGQIDIAKVMFASDQTTATLFTNAPVQNGGVRLSSGAGSMFGGVEVDANAASGASAGSFSNYSIGSTRFTVAADEVAKVENGDVSVKNGVYTTKVHNSADGVTGKLTLDSGVLAQYLDEVIATSGDVEFKYMAAANGSAAAAAVSLSKLEIGDGKTVGFYEAAAPTSMEEMVAETSVTVVGTLTAGAGARLNADLNMASGSTLDVSATGGMGLLMGSTVTLNEGVTLSSGDMTDIIDLGFMESYTLFTGVDAFSYDGGTPTATPIAFDSETWVKASQVFSNDEFTGGKDYYVFYSGVQNGGNVGAVYVMQIPEPTTGTLSLLALAALAARRRRKG